MKVHKERSASIPARTQVSATAARRQAQSFPSTAGRASTQAQVAALQQLAGDSAKVAQLMELQAMARPSAALQLQTEFDEEPDSVPQLKANRTGLPDSLKNGMERMTGYALDHVRVHYNSAKPATLQAHAYAQGSDIHVAAGQQRHVAHELGHVVQQMEGRVTPTTSVGGVGINDDPGLEREATAMGERAMRGGR